MRNILKDIFKQPKENKEEDKSPAYKAYLAADLSKYRQNEYIVFGSFGIYGHGMHVDKILEKFRQEYPDEVPFVAKVTPKRFVTY